MRKHGIFLMSLPLAMLITCCSNNGAKLSFEKGEYEIHSGEAVKVEQNYSDVSYAFAGEVPTGASVDEKSALITFTADTPHHSQVILTASKDEMSAQAVVTLLQENVTTTLSFITPIKNIIDGDYILVSSTNNTAITYSLKTPVTGVSIDSMTGRVSYNNAAVEGSTFVVVAESADQKIEETYNVVTGNIAKSLTATQSVEIGSKNPATYLLDFSDTPSGTEEKVIALLNGDKFAKDNEYHYDEATHSLVVDAEFLSTFKTGENTLKIVTPRNMVSVEIVMITKFIKNAVELQSINKDRESLAGYYVLENDIDLTEYLSKGHEGYNDHRGWNQIGIYHDLEEDPTRDSFTGTFDGNGHTISGFFEDRADDLAHNEGLFGYVTNQATIKNVGFVSAKQYKDEKWVNVTTKGRNFIGGFVGFNEGTIRNCWTDVDISNTHEDKIFHSIGAFAGANTGKIESCYTIGKPSGDNIVGAFVGKNFGEIINCASYNVDGLKFLGSKEPGDMRTNCHVYADADEMKTALATTLDNKIWDFPAGEWPTLKELTSIGEVNGIEIINEKDYVVHDQTLTVEVAIHPNELQPANIDKVQYTLVNPEGTGITQDGNKFDTTNAFVDSFTVTASIHTEYGDYAASKVFTIKDKVETISINDDLPYYVVAGRQYQINVTTTPAGVDGEVTFSFVDSKVANFCFFTGNVLTIKEEIMNYSTKVEHPTIAIKATANNGVSATKNLILNRLHYLGDKYCKDYKSSSSEVITQNIQNFYKDSTAEFIEFTLPGKADLLGMKVTKYSQEIHSASRSGHTVRIPVSEIKSFPDRTVPFTFITGAGEDQVLYRGYACYINHNKLTTSDLPTEVIALASKEDFYSHFRMKLTNEDESAKLLNYDKTYVLTSDIDFGTDKDLVGIGYKSSSIPDAQPFTGKIYGFGHKISGGYFYYSERIFYNKYYCDKCKKAYREADLVIEEGHTYCPDAKHVHGGAKYELTADVTKAKSDKDNTYNVGFFGFFSGHAYDIVFEKLNVKGYNRVAGFAYSSLAGSYMENIIMINCTVQNVNECDFTTSDGVSAARFVLSCAGSYVGVSYNGTIIGLVG